MTESAPTISALPTPFRGIQFRSRLEARWAVLFTDLGIEFNYEPEGYKLPEMGFLETSPQPVTYETLSERLEEIVTVPYTVLPAAYYLPDFWLPHINSFLEIKPNPVNDPRHKQLAYVSRKVVYVAAGNFPATADDMARMYLQSYWPGAMKYTEDSALVLFPQVVWGMLDLACRKATRFQFRL